MSYDWRRAEPAENEIHFNPRVAAEGAMELIQGLTRRSEAARPGLNGRYDVRFGAGEKETLDLFLPADTPAGARLPAQVFIHGGYWRLLDKSDHSFAAVDMVRHGIAHVSLNYDLCPGVSLDDIVAQMRHALVYLHNHGAELNIDPGQLHFAGHSAGAHLAGMLLREDWAALGLPADVIKSVSAISGIYEPEVVMQLSFKDEVGLTTEIARRNNVLAQPPNNKTRMLVSVGGGEPEGWIQQSRDYHQLCLDSGMASELVIVPDTNHFTVLDAATAAGTELFEKTVVMIKG